MAEVREWDVEADVTTSHQYTGIVARSAEEAESIVTSLLEDGDRGFVTYQNVDTVIAVPSEESEPREDYGDEEDIVEP